MSINYRANTVLPSFNTSFFSKSSLDNILNTIEKAVHFNDVNLLDQSFLQFAPLTLNELRFKVLIYGKFYNIDTDNINREIAVELGLKSDDLEFFIDDVKKIKDYDVIFLRKYIENLKISNTLFKTENIENINEVAAENLYKSIEKFDSDLNLYLTLFINKKRYTKKLKELDQYLEFGRFYRVQKELINLENIDKMIYRIKLEQCIDYTSLTVDFEELKNEIDFEMAEMDMHFRIFEKEYNER